MNVIKVNYVCFSVDSVMCPISYVSVLHVSFGCDDCIFSLHF